MTLMDLAFIALGFVGGWLAAVAWYGELCPITAAVKHLAVGIWAHRPGRAGRG